jgi:hypothetical protein
MILDGQDNSPGTHDLMGQKNIGQAFLASDGLRWGTLQNTFYI